EFRRVLFRSAGDSPWPPAAQRVSRVLACPAERGPPGLAAIRFRARGAIAVERAPLSIAAVVVAAAFRFTEEQEQRRPSARGGRLHPHVLWGLALRSGVPSRQVRLDEAGCAGVDAQVGLLACQR